MRVLSIIGTRPEAIKMAPVIKMLQNNAKAGVESLTVFTGQHEQIVYPIFGFFGIAPDFDLGVMKKAGSLNQLFSALMGELERIFSETQPNMVLVQGDTTSAAAAAIAAFHRKIRVGHVEAGLRTGNLDEPWPEEWYRRLITLSSGLHFAPTTVAKRNLIAEGIPPDRIIVSGNTVVDALRSATGRLRSDGRLKARLKSQFAFLDGARDVVLVTAHRRENMGEGIEKICRAVLRLCERRDVAIVFPVHPNPQVRVPVMERLGGRPNIHLIGPADYGAFVYLMMRSSLILTDSGGIQEEAPSLGKPVLIMRDVTERREAVEAGPARLVGTDPDSIIAAVSAILDGKETGLTSRHSANPFGDGRAAERIVQAVLSEGLSNFCSDLEVEAAKRPRPYRAARIMHRMPRQAWLKRWQSVTASA